MGDFLRAYFFYGVAWETDECPCAGCVDFWENYGCSNPDADPDETCLWESTVQATEEFAAASVEFGVNLGNHCRGGMPFRMLALEHLSWGGDRGHPGAVDLEGIDADYTNEQTLKVRAFCEAVNLDIIGLRIGWWVASYSET